MQQNLREITLAGNLGRYPTFPSGDASPRWSIEDWRNFPENSLLAMESAISMGAAFLASDPGTVYQQYLDKGVSMIQTDRPELLIGWLEKMGRRHFE